MSLQEGKLSDDVVMVEPLPRHWIASAAQVASRANISTLNSLALFGGQGERQRQQLASAIRHAILEHPQAVTLAGRINGSLVGVLPMIRSPYCQVSLFQGLRLLFKMPLASPRFLFRSLKLQAQGSKLDPAEPHWHLGPIAVLPEMQGRGVGVKMMDVMCDFLDQNQGSAYLETDQLQAVRHMQKLGFQVIREAEILGVHNWCMWRSPESK